MLHLQEAPSGNESSLPKPTILLVDDSEAVRNSLSLVLEHNGFAVVSAASAKEALQLIPRQTFDVLLSDLHMPHAGDGLTVVSAMRHSNPAAVTLLFSGYPVMREATAAILMQADEVLVKPLAVNRLVDIIRTRLSHAAALPHPIETTAAILEKDMQRTIEQWLARVAQQPVITVVRLDEEARSAHLPQLFHDLIERLRNPLPLGSSGFRSPAASLHGLLRRQQGYTPAMMVEESRMLQVSIFQTLQDNLHHVDFSTLLIDVMAIADEVDSQLAEAMTSYISRAELDVAC